MKKVEAYRSEGGRLYESVSEARHADLEYYQLQIETRLVDLFDVEDIDEQGITISDILENKAQLCAILGDDGRERSRDEVQPA